MGAAKRLEKEEILKVTFRKEDQSVSEAQLRERYQKLYHAMLLGNNFHSKVKIIFNTDEGSQEVYTTIWATTDKFVVLKGGVTIPVSSISDVILD